LFAGFAYLLDTLTETRVQEAFEIPEMPHVPAFAMEMLLYIFDLEELQDVSDLGTFP
jgi:hypothetical protein